MKTTRFIKSESGNPNGRPKSTPNKGTQDIKEFARAFLESEEYIERTLERIRNGTESPKIVKLFRQYAEQLDDTEAPTIVKLLRQNGFFCPPPQYAEQPVERVAKKKTPKRPKNPLGRT